MATSGSGRLIANNGSYDVPIDYSWTRDSNGVVSWKAQIYAIGGGTGQYDSSPCWTSFYIRGGNNSTGDLTGNLVEYCASCSQCAQYYQGNILWQHNDVRGGSLTGTINMGTGGGTLKLGYYGQRNGANTSEDYLSWGVDPVISPPTGLNVTNISTGRDYVNANVGITGWGVGSGTRYRELQVWTNGMVEPRRYKAANGDATSGYITCDNSSSGTLTIMPNTTYTIGGYASNGQANTGSQNFGNATTLPPVPSATYNSKSATGFSFNYSIPNQGGAKTINLQYKVDSGSWTTGTTISGSGAKTGEVSVGNLVPNTNYTIAFRTNTSAGSSNGDTISGIYTSVPTPIMEVRAVGKHDATLNYYVPNQGAAKTLYLEITIDGGNWIQKATIDTAGEKYGSITLTGFAPETSHSVQYRLRSADGTTVSAGPITFTTHETYAKGYCSVNNQRTPIVKWYCSVGGTRKRVIKVYGSVNGQRKLVWEEP